MVKRKTELTKRENGSEKERDKREREREGEREREREENISIYFLARCHNALGVLNKN